MSLSHAILGLLQWRPMTGYELKTDYFDGSIAHFWPADQAQIYRTLDKMTEQGWVESQIEYQEDRPNRKIYTLTDAGRTELARWLTTFQPLPVNREPFLIQLFFANQLSNETIIDLLDAQLKAHQELLAHYEAIPLARLDDPDINREQALQRLTLELGLRIEQTYIDWIKASIEVVRKLNANSAEEN